MFNCWGPVSYRHNDNWTLNYSQVLDKLGDLQRLQRTKYVLYGDSAYWPDDFIRSRHRDENLSERQVLENDSMSKCRQSIEWEYGEVGNLWKKITYKKGLKLREQPVGDLIITCFLLTNAYNTLNGNITAEYFQCSPPTLEEWTASGPRSAEFIPVPEWNDVVFEGDM